MTDETQAILAELGMQVTDPRAPLTRSEFDRLTPAERMAHVRAGRVVAHDPTAPPSARDRAPAGTMRRVDFDRLPQNGRLSVIRSGVRVID